MPLIWNSLDPHKVIVFSWQLPKDTIYKRGIIFKSQVIVDSNKFSCGICKYFREISSQFLSPACSSFSLMYFFR